MRTINTKHISLVFSSILLVLITLGCKNKQYASEDQPINGNVAQAIKIAKHMVEITWTPILPISYNIGIYQPHMQSRGIPYSSVKELKKLIRFDVSIYTFLSSLENSYSKIYSEDLRSSKYNSENATAFYGTVCSAFVCYAFGMDYYWPTYMLTQHKDINHIPIANLLDIKLADILLFPGHMMMVTRIFRDEYGNLHSIEISEAEQRGVISTIYSRDQFEYIIRTKNIELYRYNKLYSNTYSIKNPLINYYLTFPGGLDIISEYGDKVSIGERTDLHIDIINDNTYTDIKVFRDNKLIMSRPIKESRVKVGNVECGDYEVYMDNNSTLKKSTSLLFEVINNWAQCTVLSNQQVQVNFSSKNSTPLYVSIVDKKGYPFSYKDIDHNDISSGNIIMDIPMSDKPLYVKVHFQGKFGRVISDPCLITK